MVALVRLVGRAGSRREEVPREARPETPIRPKGRLPGGTAGVWRASLALGAPGVGIAPAFWCVG